MNTGKKKKKAECCLSLALLISPNTSNELIDMSNIVIILQAAI